VADLKLKIRRPLIRRFFRVGKLRSTTGVSHESAFRGDCHRLDTDTCLISSTILRTGRLIQAN
jgi:hypothetical protein